MAEFQANILKVQEENAEKARVRELEAAELTRQKDLELAEKMSARETELRLAYAKEMDEKQAKAQKTREEKDKKDRIATAIRQVKTDTPQKISPQPTCLPLRGSSRMKASHSKNGQVVFYTVCPVVIILSGPPLWILPQTGAMQPLSPNFLVVLDTTGLTMLFSLVQIRSQPI